MQLGIGLEFARGRSVSFNQAAQLAVDAGYRLIEPYVYSPSSLQLNSHLRWDSQSGYHHINANDVDVDATRALMHGLDLHFSAFDAHSTLLMPHIGIPYVTSAIDLAAQLDCPIVMTDEGPVPHDWIDMNRAFDVMCLSLEQIVSHAQKRRVRVAIELHNALTTRPNYLAMLLRRFAPNDLGVNFDTGNAFLAGNNPAEMLSSIADRIIHVHIKDIPESELPLRGKVTGTRVGVAAGDGVIDLRHILKVLAAAGYSGVLSVECDTFEQAQRSRIYLSGLVQEMNDSPLTHDPARPSHQFSAALANRMESKARDT
jgi:sugar phosphate isomerase/epimerase